jgi:hypothetical protein
MVLYQLQPLPATVTIVLSVNIVMADEQFLLTAFQVHTVLVEMRFLLHARLAHALMDTAPRLQVSARSAMQGLIVHRVRVWMSITVPLATTAFKEVVRTVVLERVALTLCAQSPVQRDITQATKLVCCPQMIVYHAHRDFTVLKLVCSRHLVQ